MTLYCEDCSDSFHECENCGVALCEHCFTNGKGVGLCQECAKEEDEEED